MKAGTANIVEIEDEICAALLVRARNGGPADEVTLTTWVAQREGRAERLVRLQRAWDGAGTLSEAPQMTAWRTTARESLGNAPQKRRTRSALAAATAIVLLAGGLGWRLWPPAGPSLEQVVVTSLAGTQTVRLGDGSQITMDRASRIAVRLTDRERRIRLLRGQARFVVARDATRPFYVQADGREVRATGTDFIVDSGNGRFVTSLISGGVIVSRLSEQPAWFGLTHRITPTAQVQLAAGQQFVAHTNGAESVRPFDPAEASGWERGQVVFDSEPVASAAETLNRYATTRVVIEGDALRKARISGTFAVGNVASFADTVQTLFPEAHVITDEDQILIATQLP